MAAPGLDEIATTTQRNRSMKEVPKTKAGKAAKVEKTMHEFKKGDLHSGSKTGPKVKSREQAVAIALNQAGESKYDRSAHWKGNPGFPSSSEAGQSPPPETYRSHEMREGEVMGGGYEKHEAMEKAAGAPHSSKASPLKAHGFGHTGSQRQGHHRLSGHSGAHRIGSKRR